MSAAEHDSTLHPFQRIPAGRARRRLLTALLAGTLGMSAIMYPPGKRLFGPSVPWGMVSFELARSRVRALAILAAWSRAGVLDDAVRSVWLDYGFIFFYSNALALACVMVAEGRPGRHPSRAGLFLAWGAWLAGVCNVVQDVAMLATLGRQEGSWPAVAFYSSVTKFALIGMALVYAGGGAVRAGRRRPS
jgi:hypothetical protein